VQLVVTETSEIVDPEAARCKIISAKQLRNSGGEQSKNLGKTRQLNQPWTIVTNDRQGSE